MANADDLALSQTIMTGVGLLAVILAVVALCTERIRRVREDDERYPTTKSALMGCFNNKPVSAIGSLLGRQAPALVIPCIEGLIEAADRGLWTSTTLDQMPDIHPELSWIPLYESVLDTIQHSPQLPKAWVMKEPMCTIFRKMNTDPDHATHRLMSLVKRCRDLHGTKLANCIRRLPRVEGQRKDEREEREKDAEKGLARIRPTWTMWRKPCIHTTREELVALCLMMGMPITMGNNSLYYSGIGAYGLSIDLIHIDATWKLSIVKGSRVPQHAPSMGSGYTSLMAKHLACGSIPFAESTYWIRSVYVTDSVLAGVKRGDCVRDVRAYGGPDLEFLRRLPSDKNVDAYYGLDEGREENTAGSILNADSEEVGRWARLVAGVAFGGLVPQAAPNVVAAVQFTVAGKVGECVQNLETLIDQLHKADTEACLFGNRVAERTGAKGHAYVNHAIPPSERNPRDAASTFARYMNLLERVVACVPTRSGAASESMTVPGANSRQGDLEKGVEMQPLQDTAVNGNVQEANEQAATRSDATQPSDQVFDATVRLLERVYQTAVKAEKGRAQKAEPYHPQGSQQDILTPEEQNLLNADLGSALASIGGNLGKIDLKDASTIVRCILAAWADTVPRIITKGHFTDSAAPSQDGTKVEVVSMDSFPSVVVLE